MFRSNQSCSGWPHHWLHFRYASSALHGKLSNGCRIHQHRPLRPRSKRNVANAGTIHDGLRRDLWVRAFSQQFRYDLMNWQFLHGHRHHHPHRELANRNRGFQQDQPPAHTAVTTVSEPARFPRRQELDGYCDVEEHEITSDGEECTTMKH